MLDMSRCIRITTILLYFLASEKNTKKDAQFNQKYQRTEYYGGSSFQQAEVYDERSEGYNRENE